MSAHDAHATDHLGDVARRLAALESENVELVEALARAVDEIAALKRAYSEAGALLSSAVAEVLKLINKARR